MKARFRRIVELIQGYGLERVHEPHIKHLQGALWEMRMKTPKTPKSEIALALARAKEVK